MWQKIDGVYEAPSLLTRICTEQVDMRAALSQLDIPEIAKYPEECEPLLLSPQVLSSTVSIDGVSGGGGSVGTTTAYSLPPLLFSSLIDLTFEVKGALPEGSRLSSYRGPGGEFISVVPLALDNANTVGYMRRKLLALIGGTTTLEVTGKLFKLPEHVGWNFENLPVCLKSKDDGMSLASVGITPERVAAGLQLCYEIDKKQPKKPKKKGSRGFGSLFRK